MKRAVRLLAVVGAIGTVAALAKIHASSNGYDLTSSTRFAWAATYTALLCLCAYANGIPDVVPLGWLGLVRAAMAVAEAALAVSIVQLVVGDALLPRFVVFGAAVFLVPWYAACIALAGHGRTRAEGRDRVLVVAAETDVGALRDELAEDFEQPAIVVGSLTAEEATPTGDAADPLRHSAQTVGATVVVLGRLAQEHDAVVHQAAKLHEAGIRVRTLSQFYEQWLGKLPVSDLERISLFFDIGEVHRTIYGRASRLLDLAIASIGVLGLVVAMPVVGLGNLVANRGPLFYRQPRVGKGGIQFQIYKFRTMRSSIEGMANEWTTEDDPRITPFGRLLRRTHMDELPQFLNILRGDVSVVGPRPEQPHYVEELETKLPFYDLRHLVRPGLTGWAQVKYGYAGTEGDALQKLQYEFFYLRHQSLRLDLRIIGRTLRSVAGRRGR